MSGQGPVRLGVFAKFWAPGRAKTRLAATIGNDAAAKAAERFVEVTTQRLKAIASDRLLCFTPAEERRAFESLGGVADGGWRIAPQPAGTLGDRMRWFFNKAHSEGNAGAVLVGADSPDLPVDAVTRAIDWLTSTGVQDRMVFGPTRDGGYWLIGSKGQAGPVFDDMPWSTPQLMDGTLRKLHEAGWERGREYELVDEWYDVDTGDDLEAMRRRVEASRAADAALVGLADEARAWLVAAGS